MIPAISFAAKILLLFGELNIGRRCSGVKRSKDELGRMKDEQSDTANGVKSSTRMLGARAPSPALSAKREGPRSRRSPKKSVAPPAHGGRRRPRSQHTS